MQLNESIDISGLSEKNVHGPVIRGLPDSEDAERMAKTYTRIQVITCKLPSRM